MRPVLTYAEGGKVAVGVLAVLFAPLAALAQSTRQVEVMNFPTVQDVNVVGGASADCPAPFRLVGFTAAVFTGNLGGPFGATQKCQAEFPGSRMCTYSEAVATLQLPSGLVGTAWMNVDAGPTTTLPMEFEMQCGSWTSSSSTGCCPSLLDSDGRAITSTFFCSSEHPIACCAAVP